MHGARCCIAGGNWDNAAEARLFALNVNNVPGNLNANIGARLLGKKILCTVFLATWQKYQTAKSDKYREPGTSDFLLSTK